MDSSLYEYMFHHIVLPPQLPQQDDHDATHHKPILEFLLSSIEKLSSLSADYDEREAYNNISRMLDATSQVLDDGGNITTEALLSVFQQIAKAGQYSCHHKASLD